MAAPRMHASDASRNLLAKFTRGALCILNSGVQWHMLPQRFSNCRTVLPRFQQWCSGVLRDALCQFASVLHESGALDQSKFVIDATFSPAKGGGDAIGPTMRG